VRARYYHEALQIFSAHTWHGAGADGFGLARKHYSIDSLSVQHAHSFLFQTLADLGVLGLLVTLALFAAWAVAAWRPLHLRGPRPATPERVGMLTLAATVILYGVHSLVDWTWFIPGTTVLALVCAGWLAGRGPLTERAATGGWSRDPLRIGAAVAVFATALLVSYTILQPLRAVHSDNAAYAALARGDIAAASRAAQRAHRQDRLSVEPLFALAQISGAAGRQDAETAALEQAVRLQPRNPDTWSMLGEHILVDLHDAKAAVAPLGAAVYLDPHGLSGLREQQFVQARQEAGAQ
jgi:tetratricopeptide (TPR) repeat protein